MSKILLVALAALLSACGGGDEFIRSAERSCPGPFTGSLGSACQVELQLAGDETIFVEITGRLVAANSTSSAGEVSRDLHAQLAGVSAGFQDGMLALDPGVSAGVEFLLEATVPAANLGSANAVIGLSSFERTGSLPSSIVDVRVKARAAPP